jgi:hypothetical protein
MSLTLLIVLITAVVAGVGFWFYNRRQINSLTETIEDKTMVINSFRDHLNTKPEPATFDATEKTISVSPHQNTPNPEKKKKRYGNRPKKNGNGEQQKDVQKQNPQKRGRKPNTQQ